MSDYQPKVGDRVRVVLEGEVTYKGDPSGMFDIDGKTPIAPGWGHVVSVEKVAPPLPTTPGSVITFNRPLGDVSDGLVYSLEPDGWRNTSRGWEVGQSDMQRMADRYGFTVLHDAGEVTP